METKKYRIYLDVCCLNRPFDDLSNDRVRLEADAVLSVLSHCNAGEWTLVNSDENKCDVFLTTDDRFLKKARTQELFVKAANPAIWIMEVL